MDRFIIIAADSRRGVRACRIKSAAAAAADMTGFSTVLAGYGECSACCAVRVLGQCGVIIGCGNNIVRVVGKDYVYISAAVVGNFDGTVFI